jgi:hypothetical protein
MVLSYITTMLYTNHFLQCEGEDIEEELTLPIQMPETQPSTSIHEERGKGPHHIISIIDFIRHTRHTMYSQEHRISIPTTSRL